MPAQWPLNEREIERLGRSGASHASIGTRFGVSGEVVGKILDRLGVPRRRRVEKSSAPTERDELMLELYENGMTFQQIGVEMGVRWTVVSAVLEGRKERRRGEAKVTPSREKRDCAIVALYRKGLNCREVGEKLGLKKACVRGVLDRRGIARRRSWDYPRTRRRDWEENKAKIASIEHLYNTGVGTSATKLAGRIGLNPQTLRRHLHAKGIVLKSGSGKATPGLNAKTAREVKAALVETDLSFVAIGKRFGVSSSAIANVAAENSWKHIPWPKGKRYKGRPFNVLTEADARRIKVILSKPGPNLSEIAKQYGVSVGAITGIVRGTTWKHVPWPKGASYVPRRTGGASVLSEVIVAKIKEILTRPDHPTFDVLGKKFGVRKDVIYAISTGKSWPKVPWPAGKTYYAIPKDQPSRLNKDQVAAIKAELTRGEKTLEEIAFPYSVSASAILAIAKNRTWKHVPWPKGKGYKPNASGTRAWDRRQEGVLEGPMTRNQERRRGSRSYENDIDLLPRAGQWKMKR